MIENNIPNFNNNFFCIVHRKRPSLAAIISSYINESGKYTPLFEFPEVYTSSSETDKDKLEVNVITITRAEEFAIRVNNALACLKNREFVILAGLDENQKSFLRLPEELNILEIDTIDEVDFRLKEIVGKTEYLNCRERDILSGLYYATSKNCLLKIDEYAEAIPLSQENKDGIIIIENSKSVTPVIAINYAVSFDLAIAIIEKPNVKRREIKALIDSWKDENNESSYLDLSSYLYNNVESINFEKYRFATFFTFGAPYSLILKDIIPFTYVNTSLNPDFFIFNNFLIEKRDSFFSSVVFSPLEFGEDEETNFVLEKLKSNNYFVKELIGKDASVSNITNHVKEFPYEILHICSHGGEVWGFSLKEEFIDRDGNVHIVEYDEVVSFSPEEGKELVGVTITNIWRKFDGLVWGSKEFKSADYPHYVFTDMMNKLNNIKGESRKRKEVITDSSAIKCNDFHYQPAFNMIAGFHSHPFIFNNTCYSWSDISDSFLSIGARGYIGTLWAVENEVAKKTAETFYDCLFENTILNSLQNAMHHSTGTSSENIYIFWGLHFSAFKKGNSIAESRINIASKLLTSFYRWRDHLKGVKDKNTQQQINELISWNSKQLEKYFKLEALKLIQPPKL